MVYKQPDLATLHKRVPPWVDPDWFLFFGQDSLEEETGVDPFDWTEEDEIEALSDSIGD